MTKKLQQPGRVAPEIGLTKKVQQPGWVRSDLVLTEEQWQSIATAGNVVVLEAHRNSLLRAINHYRENSDLENGAIRPGKIKAALDEFEKSLVNARSTISKLLTGKPPENRAALRELSLTSIRELSRAKSVGRPLDPRRYVSAKNIKVLIKQISDLVDLTRVAAKALPKDVGRVGDPNIGALLGVANSVFLEAAGDGRYTANSINFLRAVCEFAGYQVQSDDALKQALKTLAKG